MATLPPQHFLGLIVRDLLYIVFDIVVAFVLAPMPPAEFVKIAIDLILVVVLVHEVRHVTERLQFASRVIQACNHKALKNLVIGSPNRTEANLIEKAAVNEVRAYQAKLVLAYTGKNGIICRSIILDEQLLSELLFVSPLAGFALKRNQGGFVSAAAKGLLYAVFAADLGNDLDGDGSALILLPPDKHTTKVAICRGTPKFDSLSASHAAVGPIFRKVTKKCGKQEMCYSI